MNYNRSKHSTIKTKYSVIQHLTYTNNATTKSDLNFNQIEKKQSIITMVFGLSDMKDVNIIGPGLVGDLIREHYDKYELLDLRADEFAIIAVWRGYILGYCCVLRRNPYIYIGGLKVVISWRGYGIGSKIMRYVIEHAENQWTHLLAGAVLPNVQGFLLRFGFKYVVKEKNYDGTEYWLDAKCSIDMMRLSFKLPAYQLSDVRYSGCSLIPQVPNELAEIICKGTKLLIKETEVIALYYGKYEGESYYFISAYKCQETREQIANILDNLHAK